MALHPRRRLWSAQNHLRTVLRASLNAQIVAINAELGPGVDPIAEIADTTAQIQVGDHPDYEPEVYPSIRIGFPRTLINPVTSQATADSVSTRSVALYLEKCPDAGECAGDLVQQLHDDALLYLEAIRACIERDLPSDPTTLYGDRIAVLGYEDTTESAPQDPDDACSMRGRYEMTLEWMLRVRHSRDAAD